MHANCPNGDGNQSSFGRFRYYYVNYRILFFLLDGNGRVVPIMMMYCYFSEMYSHLHNMASHFFKGNFISIYMSVHAVEYRDNSGIILAYIWWAESFIVIAKTSLQQVNCFKYLYLLPDHSETITVNVYIACPANVFRYLDKLVTHVIRGTYLLNIILLTRDDVYSNRYEYVCHVNLTS